jgi:hypothetical protein
MSSWRGVLINKAQGNFTSYIRQRDLTNTMHLSKYGGHCALTSEMSAL